MKIYIIEDEPLAADHLIKTILSVLPQAEIKGRADNVREAVSWLAVNQPELIFMDIHLGDALSFEIFNQVQITAPVIFTTAYDQYAIRAFQLNGIGYLLKPIAADDVQEALYKLDTLRKHLGNETLMQSLITQIKAPAFRERFMVTAGSKLRSVNTSEIAWFVSEGRYSKIVTRDNHRYLINDTMEKLEGALSPTRFFRINRKYIVAIDCITSMIPWSKSRIKIELIPNTEDEVVVSVERSAEFKHWLDH
ncbi:MAG: LytR/AlgR family response regulator transcription factor [Bacteroidia bacterium]